MHILVYMSLVHHGQDGFSLLAFYILAMRQLLEFNYFLRSLMRAAMQCRWWYQDHVVGARILVDSSSIQHQSNL